MHYASAENNFWAASAGPASPFTRTTAYQRPLGSHGPRPRGQSFCQVSSGGKTRGDPGPSPASSHRLTPVMLLLTTAAALILTPAVVTLGVAAAASGTVVPAVTAWFCPAGTAGPGTGTGHGRALTTAQVGNARVIYAVTLRMRLPTRAPVIAIAAAMQESSLINLTTAAG
ncbi:MAG TPA: hypothetical protein VFQ44_04160 [Streptosporangiaceae bacterium]|nr:hypothetical protein [Streptosporangiaceae bacterium]